MIPAPAIFDRYGFAVLGAAGRYDRDRLGALMAFGVSPEN